MKASHLLLAVFTLTAAASSQAASVIWSVAEFDDVAQLRLDGGLVGAFNLGTSVPVAANGILFDTGGSITNGTILALSYVDGTLYDSLAEPIVGLSTADADTLLDSLVYLPGVGNNRWRLSGLAPGQEYLIQFLASDDRFPPAVPPTVTADYALFEGGGASGVGAVTSGRMNAPSIFTGTFVADAFNQDIFMGMTNGGGNNLQVAAYQLRAVPEPAAAGLAVVGAAALAMRRRRW